MAPGESKTYDIPGATGPGITIRVHERPCALPASARPKPYPYPYPQPRDRQR
ncbi:hypothetical protein ACFYY1_19635 [Streptomyces sp. NPDC001890]|uniref:hypothetical protein n=1 Tax=Streptomyces sp. NPDC001890 TaxID=3364620 RepID=UPI00367E3868